MLEQYRRIRDRTERLCAPLEIEDYVIQSMPDVSPPKWHLGHTTWFFDQFVIAQKLGTSSSAYSYVFNSYYDAIGTRVERQRRGLLSRPTVKEIYGYRAEVDELVCSLSFGADELKLIELGINHEEQHQELLITDIKHILWSNPTRPSYNANLLQPIRANSSSFEWLASEAGVYEIGAQPGDAFSYDNESPRHRVFLTSYAIASRPVACGEFREFIEDGGYKSPELWLSDGWKTACALGWQAPLYWERIEGRWHTMTLEGMKPLDEHEPVCHISYYEADAYARWRGFRLPTEAEWEAASAQFKFGDVWEWTLSSYLPYPGYRPFQGAFAEYNGKFMCNQMVLRGGSRATPAGHARATYRNFFSPETRWQFSGFRMAKDANR